MANALKVTEVYLNAAQVENLRGRFYLQVDRSGKGCWPWLGPRHSSGHGRYLWRSVDGGNDRYVLAQRVAYYLSTGELPRYLRNLCGNKLCCKASHWWAKPTGSWKPKPQKAIRGRVRQLPASEIKQIRLRSSISRDDEEIGRLFGLTRRQVARIAMGRERVEAGGRIRPSRFRGIRYYHAEFEKRLRDMRPPELGPPQPQKTAPPTTTSTVRPFPAMPFGQKKGGRRLPYGGHC
jgi:hypothetical protein